MNFELSKEELKAIHELSGGHPFLARQVASALYELRDDESRERILANPVRFSSTLRSYFPENVWGPLNARGETAVLAILTALAEADSPMLEAELEARCRQPNTELWPALEWLEHVGMIAKERGDGSQDRYRIRIGMFAQWFHQSEVSVR